MFSHGTRRTGPLKPACRPPSLDVPPLAHLLEELGVGLADGLGSAQRAPSRVEGLARLTEEDEDAVDFSRGDAESTNGGMSPGQVIDVSSHIGDA